MWGAHLPELALTTKDSPHAPKNGSTATPTLPLKYTIDSRLSEMER